MSKGLFIVIDGVDGSGKATQTQLLLNALKASGHTVQSTDFPQYGKKSAGLVEEYLNGKYGMVDPYVGSMFYAVDRFDASFKLREWLASGHTVVSNRYVTANAGHQGGKIDTPEERLKFYRWLCEIEFEIFKIPQPDLTVLLRVPPDLAQVMVDAKIKEVRGYLEKGGRDLHENDLDHLIRADQSYQQIVDVFPNTVMVECHTGKRLLNQDEVHQKIWTHVKELI